MNQRNEDCKMTDRKMFPNSVIPIPTSGVTAHGLIASAADPRHREEKMDVSFSLSVPPEVQKELEARVDKGETISPQELKTKYAVDSNAASSLAAWLKKEGFAVTEVTPDQTTIYASAPASQIEASLGVHMVRVTREGQTYTAASDVPSLPEDVAQAVVHIGGLQPYRQARKHLRSRMQVKAEAALEPTVAYAPPYLAPEILKAYGGAGLGLSGNGQEIAILIDTVPLDTDLTAFWTANGVTQSLARITKINVKGGTLPAPSGEETLDAQWASTIAPEANVRIYASGTLSFVDLDRALDRIYADALAQPTLRIVSISLGLSEAYMTEGEVNAEEARFVRFAALGVNVFVSTGDAGSNPGPDGQHANGPLAAEWMATSPHVVAVGGTSLRLAANGQVASETGWTGSGGGKSKFFPRPAWQQGNGVPASNQRMIPDVGAAADPNEGGLIILNGQRLQYGGTSWSAPIWAGLCALINEARLNNHKPPLPYLNPLIYPTIGSNCFRDVLTQSNGAYSCGPGFDLVTGIGSPDLKQLVAKLV
jgi:kumamolisin